MQLSFLEWGHLIKVASKKYKLTSNPFCLSSTDEYSHSECNDGIYCVSPNDQCVLNGGHHTIGETRNSMSIVVIHDPKVSLGYDQGVHPHQVTEVRRTVQSPWHPQIQDLIYIWG